jgi:pimeloyl-ACP methyl ester carboxylesterase
MLYSPDSVSVRAEDLYEQYAVPPNEAAAWALIWCIRRLRYGTLVRRLRDVKCPTLIVHGEEDCWIPSRYASRLQALLPDARLALIPRTRHMPELESPDTTLLAIRAFLDELPEIHAVAQ